jgi:SAM-dependent methyltransferase
LKDHKNWFENPDYKLFGYLYKKIKKFNNSDKLSILDAGCGIGTFLKYIAKREPDARLVGIDLISNEFSGIRFIKGDILNEEIGETFNVACGIVVAEHIEYPEILVKNIRRVLKPGGTFIITTLNDDGLIYSIARFLKKAGIRSAYDRIYSTHNLQYYTGRSLRWLVEANGFDVVCHERHNYSLRSVDVPGGSVFVRAFYKTVTAAIFLLSNMVGKQLLQTIVCKKRKE